MLTIISASMMVAMGFIAMFICKVWSNTRKLVNRARCAVAGSALLLLAVPLATNASVVFQADFNGSSGSTIGQSNSIVTLGGTATLFNGGYMTDTIETASPFFTGQPGYLHMVDSAGTSGSPGGVNFYPTSAAASMDSWLTLQSGTMTFCQLTGGLDFFFRTNLPSSAWQTGYVNFRPLDLYGGPGGLRFIIGGGATNRMDLELVVRNSAGTVVQRAAASSTVSVAADTLYHMAATATTNPTTGVVTTKLFLAQGNTPINTASSTHLIITATTAGAVVSTGTNAINHAFNSMTGFVFGNAYVNTAEAKTIDFASFRIYNSVPATFDAVAYLPDLPNVAKPNPEPTLPTAFDLYSPHVIAGGTAAANTPIGGEWTRTGDPADGLIVAGDLLSSYTGTDAGKDSAYLCYGQNASVIQSANAAIERQVDDNAVIRLDGSLPSSAMYLIWPRNANGYGVPMAINQTEAWWIGPDRVIQGGTTSLFGRNLSYSISGTASSNAWIYIKPQGVASGTWVTPTAVNPYKVDFVMPVSLTSGTYEVWSHNGHGGHYGWSKPVLVTVTGTSPWTAVQFNVKDAPFNAVGNGVTDDTNAIKRALAASGSYAYSTVYFPAGTYMVSSQLQSPPSVRWLGVGATSSIIKIMSGNRNGLTMLGVPTSTANIAVVDMGLDAGTNYGFWDLFLINGYVSGTTNRMSGLTLENCILTGTNVCVATPTASAFASGTNAITVSSVVNIGYGSQVTGNGLHSNTYVSGINGNVLQLSRATIASSTAQTITVVGNNQGLLGSAGIERLVCKNVTFNGKGIYMNNANQVIFDGCTFNMMFDGFALNITGSSSHMSFTNNLCQDMNYFRGLTYDPATSSYAGDTYGKGWGVGVFFKGAGGLGAIHNRYYGNNTSYNMGVRLQAQDTNWGEHISLEINPGFYYGTPTAATGTSVTFNPATTGTFSTIASSTPLIVTVIHGTGLAQWRDVGSFNAATGLVTLAAGQTWNVVPDATSTVAIGSYAANIVTYRNNFTGKSDRVGPTADYGITGFLPYGGVLTAVTDSDTYNYAKYGWRTVSCVPESANAAFAVMPVYFHLYLNNQMNNCQHNMGMGMTSSYYYDNTLEMASSFGHVYRKNRVSNSVAGSSIDGISVETPYNDTSDAIDFILFDNNSIADAPHGINAAVVTQGNLLFLNNTISKGTAVSSSSYGVYSPAGAKMGFGGNSYTGFASTYTGVPPGAIMEAPYRVVETSASRAKGVSATGTVTVWNGGTSSVGWSATDDQTWLTVSPVSGTVADENSESTFTVTCAPGTLTDGTYTGTVTLTCGTQTKKVQVLFTVIP